MGTKIKNHFRAENWIKIKPKMWFNQVRIILFYIIQIKIKLNVKLKIPHVSDQYRRVIFEYNIHQVVKIFYLYHVVSKLVEHFASTTEKYWLSLVSLFIRYGRSEIFWPLDDFTTQIWAPILVKNVWHFRFHVQFDLDRNWFHSEWVLCWVTRAKSVKNSWQIGSICKWAVQIPNICNIK